MKIKLWGVRGSIPTSTPHTKKYGGNTHCVEIRSGEWQLILDAGSGIQSLNFENEVHARRIDILLTHLHIDHIQGLGVYKPLFHPETEIHIWGPLSSTQSLRTRLGRYFSPPLFPVYFRNLTCELHIHEIHRSTFQIGPFTIHSDFIIHPGPTVGYRVRHSKGVFTYLPDHEPALGKQDLLLDPNWISGSSLAHDADILMHDAQYTAEEYQVKSGWGHCSMKDALSFAERTRVKHLLLTHHDPMRSDHELDNILKEIRKLGPFSFSFEMAKEESVFEL